MNLFGGEPLASSRSRLRRGLGRGGESASGGVRSAGLADPIGFPLKGGTLMVTIETIATVTEDGTITARVPGS